MGDGLAESAEGARGRGGVLAKDAEGARGREKKLKDEILTASDYEASG